MANRRHQYALDAANATTAHPRRTREPSPLQLNPLHEPATHRYLLVVALVVLAAVLCAVGGLP